MKTNDITLSPQWLAALRTGTSTRLYEVPASVNSVLIVGGMDTLPPARILSSAQVGCAGAGLRAHKLVIVTLHRHKEDGTRLPYTLGLSADMPERPLRTKLDKKGKTSRFDARAAALATRVLRWADENAEFDEHGQASNLIARLMAAQIRLPLAYLYDRSHAALEYARLVQLLADGQVTTIIGASFGGSVILDTIIRATHAKLIPARPLTLITLGTNFGEILTRSPLYQDLPRTPDGRIACPEHVRWTHFYSDTDVFVGASARPRHFSGCEEVKVHTGPFLTWPPTKAHAMALYLRTPEVQRALRAAINA